VSSSGIEYRGSTLTLAFATFLQEISMNTILKSVLAVVALAAASQAAAQVTFYEREGFEGRSFTTESDIPDFRKFGFNDRASSVWISGGVWALCEEPGFRGRCVVLGTAKYASLAMMGLDNRVSSIRHRYPGEPMTELRNAPAAVPAQALRQITLYEREDFQGRSFTTEREIQDLGRFGFNDRASSVWVSGGVWALCDEPGFRGRCVVLGTAKYPSLAAMGLDNRVSSTRYRYPDEPMTQLRNAPAPVPVYEYRRRHDERLYDANVISVRAVVGPPEQRCWVEREQVVQERSGPNVPGAVAGAVIGGILGHQVGSGRGNDLATVGGAVAGAAVGANVGRDGGQQVVTQDVQRCLAVPSQARPQYWDVVYNFRGQDHRVQMTAPPGPTVTVNEWGEPRE
jgi:uncharacterized protein YcfJ